jgi:type IX secretion system PorP/SprF family membrane protein
MKKITPLACLIFLVLGSQVRSQDIHFSQLQESPLHVNPANTGFFNGYFRAIGNYRNQWASMGNPYNTMGLSVDGGLFRNKKKSAFLGLGLTFFSDKAGAAKISNNQINLFVSGIVKVSSKAALSAGVYGGASFNNANYSALTYGTQYNGVELDPNLPSQESVNFRRYTTNDIGAGVAYEYMTSTVHNDRDDIFSVRFGAAVYHLNEPRLEFGTGYGYRMPQRFSYFATARIDVPNSKLTLAPHVVIFTQGPASEYNFGTFIKYRFKEGTKVTGEKVENSIGIGAYYRMNDALIPQILVDMGEYAIGISYDVNISNYKKASRTVGGFEISLRYNKLADALFKKKHEYRN